MVNTIIPSDKDILSHYKNNRREGFSLMYYKYADRLLSVCRRYSADSDDAIDYFHEAMIKIDSKIGSFRLMDEGSLLRWMIKLTVNLIIDHQRKNKKISFVTIDPDNIDNTEDDPISGKVPIEVLYKMIDMLSPAKKTVFNLSYIEGLSRGEISRMLKITEDGVSSTLWKARKELAKMIKVYFNSGDL